MPPDREAVAEVRSVMKRARQDSAIAQDAVAAPAALLDRDGVINIDHGYSFRPSELELTPTAAQGIRMLNEGGYRVLVVTNQSGVARGLYDERDVILFHEAIQTRLAQAGAHIDAYYYCPYHPDGSVALYALDHEDRKPRPGMLLRAMKEWNVVREGSFMIGDKPSDQESADAAGIPSMIVPANSCDLAAAVSMMIARAG